MMKKYDDIELRFSNYIGNSDSGCLRARIIANKISDSLSKKLEEEVLMPNQVRAIAYLLGFTDPDYDSCSDGPFGISAKVYAKEIEKKILSEFVVDCSTLGIHFKKYGNKAFKIEGVKKAFEQLSLENKINYTPERFEEAKALMH